MLVGCWLRLLTPRGRQCTGVSPTSDGDQLSIGRVMHSPCTGPIHTLRCARTCAGTHRNNAEYVNFQQWHSPNLSIYSIYTYLQSCVAYTSPHVLRTPSRPDFGDYHHSHPLSIYLPGELVSHARVYTSPRLGSTHTCVQAKAFLGQSRHIEPCTYNTATPTSHTVIRAWYHPPWLCLWHAYGRMTS